jgi:hypothetical protein
MQIKKQFILSILILLISAIGFSQYVLKTPDGKVVKLDENGTWQYLNDPTKEINSKRIPSASTKIYISKNKKFEVWYDSNQWLCDTNKTTRGFWWDAVFNSSDYAVTGYCLESRLSLPTDNLESYIKAQFEGQGTIKSFSNFKDTINGMDFSGYDMELEWNGIIYKYRGYVYSTPKGSFQFAIGTQKEIFDEDRQKILDLFKGISKH